MQNLKVQFRRVKNGMKLNLDNFGAVNLSQNITFVILWELPCGRP